MIVDCVDVRVLPSTIFDQVQDFEESSTSLVAALSHIGKNLVTNGTGLKCLMCTHRFRSSWTGYGAQGSSTPFQM